MSEFVIVNDPGHGPGDGCSGNGVDEHAFVWEVGVRFAHMASTVPSWRVVTTRGCGTDPPQAVRDELARKEGGHIHLALHCDEGKDASGNLRPEWHGMTVFHYTSNRRTRDIAREIACAAPRELWSGRRNSGRIVAMPDPSYPRATRVVTRYTLPTVLIEFGFLSNAGDARYLASQWAPERLTATLMAGAALAAQLYKP